jgi:malate/lactate dehydrogenase
MDLALIGSGNVVAALAIELPKYRFIGNVTLIARNFEANQAIIRDVASAFPDFARRMRCAKSLSDISPSVIIAAVGAQIPPGGAARDVLDSNANIAAGYLRDRKTTAHWTILLGTPVDELTDRLARELALTPTMTLGFGGDLDVRRLCYTLDPFVEARHPPRKNEGIFIVGEHGSRAVPVFDQRLVPYLNVALDVRNFLKEIANSGRPRNLATGVLLAELLRSIDNDTPSLHHVSTYCSEYETYLTWPTLLSRAGVVGRYMPTLSREAQNDLADLINIRKKL